MKRNLYISKYKFANRDSLSGILPQKINPEPITIDIKFML